MKKLIITFIFCCNLAHSQYQIKSEYLNQPEKMFGYVDSCAKFWFNAFDESNGGFFSNINRYGNPNMSNTEKHLQSQARDAYGFTRAYMLTGNELYLTKARQALNFLYKYYWDNTNTGWFGSLDRYGLPKNRTADKSAFDQHYALLGIAAYYEATNDSLDYSWLIKGFLNNENKLWDNRPEVYGYYDNVSYNWNTKKGKSFNSTVDAITTHLLLLFQLTGEITYKNKLIMIADNILRWLYRSVPYQKTGFVELYDADWNYDNSQKMTIMGHVLKTGWCLGRIYHYIPDTTYTGAAKELVNLVLRKGYDSELGGPYKDYDRITGEMLMWGLKDTAKAWWQMEQAITAGLELYQITKDAKYLKMADETLDFFMKYFVDHEYGEVYSDRTRYGKQAWGLDKGNPNKAAYHSIETGYYVYLYGKAYVKKEPFSLYYYFQQYEKDREIILSPLEYPSEKYKIKEIIYNNQSYNNYTSLNRKIILPKGTGGKFKVTFELNETPSLIRNQSSNNLKYVLSQNYPNPFNPSTTINFRVPSISKVILKIIDLTGREIKTIVNETKQSGEYNILFSGENLASGVYFYRIYITPGNGGKQIIEQKAMILLK